jgi:hypothetical protein
MITCPDSNTLSELASGCLDEAMRPGVIAHLDACAECRRVVALAAAQLGLPMGRGVWDAPVHPGARVGPYVIQEALGSGAMGVVYSARHERLGRTVAVKLARPSSGGSIVPPAALACRDAEMLFRLKHEFRSLANLEHPNIVRLGELGCEDGQWFFTMERVHGTNFVEYVAGDTRRKAMLNCGPLEPDQERRLRGALAQLVEALAAVHESGRVHRDVKPNNVMVTPEGRVVLLDFGLVAGFGQDDRAFGTAAFMAPEQIEARELTPAADWYAVGVMLFAALTGRLPFVGATAALVRVKLAADAPNDWGVGAPEDLRSLGRALLQREPRARPGVDELRAHLGLRRRPRTCWAEVFVGREPELRRLQQAVARAGSGPPQTVVVRGEPGIGKSELVEHFLAVLPVHAPVLRGRCYEQQNVPFGGADSLVDALSEYLLGLEEHDIERCVAGGMAAAARVFPVLRRVPAIAALASTGPALDASMMRELAFGELARLVSALGEARTLVVFVDDLQWLDADSLALVRAVFLSSGSRCLLVATLRTGCTASCELDELVASAELVDLQPLTAEESLDMWRALVPEGDPTGRDALIRDAGGHPFLLVELVRAARSRASTRTGALRIEDVLWERVSQRDEVERRFLEMASIAGGPTPDVALAQAAGWDIDDCLGRVSALRAARLIRVSRVGDERCVEPYHDRIREAVIGHVRRRGLAHLAELHASLGRALWAATDEATLDSRVFQIVQHLNLGRRAIAFGIESEAQLRRLASLNLIASRQAHKATAFEHARDYAVAGIECLPAHAGFPASLELETYRDLHVARFVAEYLTLGREVARSTYHDIASRMPTPQAKAEVTIAWIDLEASNFPREAVEAGCAILAELDSRPPRRVTKLHLLSALAKARWAQRGRTAETFGQAHKLRSGSVSSALAVLVAMTSPAYQCDDENMYPWLMLRATNLSMTQGVSDASPIGFMGYAMVLAAVLGEHAEAAEFGRMARARVRAEANPRYVPKGDFTYPAFLSPWVAPIAEARRDLREAELTARRCGDAQFQTFAASVFLEHGVCMGVDLQTTSEEIEPADALAQRYRVKSVAEQCLVLRSYVKALRGATLGSIDFPATTLTTEVGRLRYHLFQAELGYLAGAEVADLERHLFEVERRGHLVRPYPIWVDVVSLRALAAARAAPSSSGLGRARRLLRLARAARRVDRWAQRCAENFAPQALLLRAELARVLGRARVATDGYVHAIRAAQTYHAAKREAMACELAAAHARSYGRDDEANRYRRRAVDAYLRWGATAKANALSGA